MDRGDGYYALCMLYMYVLYVCNICMYVLYGVLESWSYQMTNRRRIGGLALRRPQRLTTNVRIEGNVIRHTNTETESPR